MRTGLVLVGVAFLVVGGGALAVLFTVPPEPARDSTVSMETLTLGGASPSWSSPLWGQNGSDASFSIWWRATIPVTLVLSEAAESPNCFHGDPPCPASPMVKSWNGSEAGNWSSSGDPDCPYWVEATSATGAPGTVSIVATGRASGPAPGPDLEMWFGTLSGLLLVAVGSIALFLGLFLRSGPYLPRPPPPSPPGEAAAPAPADPPSEPPPPYDRGR